MINLKLLVSREAVRNRIKEEMLDTETTELQQKLLPANQSNILYTRCVISIISIKTEGYDETVFELLLTVKNGYYQSL